MRIRKEERSAQHCNLHFLVDPGLADHGGRAHAHQRASERHRLIPNDSQNSTEVSVTQQFFPNRVNFLSLHCKHTRSSPANKYLGEIRREEGRLLAALGEAGGKAGPLLRGLCLEELAGTARGLLGRARKPGGSARVEDRGVGHGEDPHGCVTV